MANIIDIEYDGSSGCAGPASQLKHAILMQFPDVEIRAANSAKVNTGTIKVSWIKNGVTETVWEKGRAETQKNHDSIVAFLKQHA